MTDMQQVKLHNHQMIYDPQSFAKIEPEMFTQDYWEARGKITGLSKGRGITTFFEHQENEFVLRHYLRGGIVGRLIKRHYFNTGYQYSRTWQEFQLLKQLSHIGLPVPKPAAAIVSRQGLFYTADIILHKISGASDVHQRLTQGELTQLEWQTIGQTIALFHQSQVFHHDLNIHNIMLDEAGKGWLIDFDKCYIKTDSNWKRDNLKRLRRSLDKEQGREKQYFFNEEGWHNLMEAYRAASF
jgi:3-deoxy-D-manno-octulosonic acid kinase